MPQLRLLWDYAWYYSSTPELIIVRFRFAVYK